MKGDLNGLQDSNNPAQVTRIFSAPPELVFDAWLAPEHIVRWMFARIDSSASRIELEARVGGEFLFEEQRGQVRVAYIGRYLEIDRARRLVFTWATRGEHREDRVTVEFRASPRGCEVTLSHELIADSQDYEDPTRPTRAWAKMLEALDRNVSERHPRLRIVRRFDAPVETLFAAWTRPEMVRRWLFTSEESEYNETEWGARVGGSWRIMDRRGGVEYTATGEFLEVSPPERFVFTFEMPQFSPNRDRITVELAPDGAGCIMTFAQDGIDIAEEVRALGPDEEGGSEHGWREMFNNLATALKNASPDPKKN